MLDGRAVVLGFALLSACGSEEAAQRHAPRNDAGTKLPPEDARAAVDVADRGVPTEPDATEEEAATSDAPVATDGGNPIDAPSADASLVTPVEQSGRYVFTAGDLTLEVDPQVGGRVTSFALAGRNLLTGPSVDPGNYGSTFWTSPQSDWGWPPLAEIDNQPYAAVVADSKLVLTGATNQRLQVSVTKTFSLNAATRSARIEYVINNKGSAQRMLAAWEVTRVRPNGLTFFPTGQGSYSYGSNPLTTQDAAGMTWFNYQASAIPVDSKFYADGSRGLLFHVAADRTVFIKRFSDAPGASHAPSEGEIEIYANGAHTYIELENQGAYVSIGPGASTSFAIEWFLRDLTAGIDVTVGNPALIAFVEGVVQ